MRQGTPIYAESMGTSYRIVATIEKFCAIYVIAEKV